MIKILWLLLIAVWMGGCGSDWADCADGCDKPEVVEHTTEVTKTVTVVGQPGPAGERGEQGLPGESIQGPQGEPGQDGINGANGLDAVLPPNTIVDVINPCGPDVLDEVILVTADGTLIAHYSDGQRQHLTVLVPGRYSVTDGHHCTFSVDDENNLTWED